MQASNGSIITTIIICAAVLLAFGFYSVSQIPDVPTVVVPTAAEIAALIVIPDMPEMPEMPDTELGVKNERKVLAEELALEEMTDDDFREELAKVLTSGCGDIDIEDEDITNIKVLDTDFKHFQISHNDDDGTVELELKVYFDNDGDDEEAGKAKVLVSFNVVDLVYNDDYEDAEVGSYTISFVKAYGDLECA